MISKTLLLSLLFVCPIFVNAQGVKIAAKEDIEAAVKAVPCKSEERLNGVKKQFVDAGARDEDIKIEKFDKDKISNVVVYKKGSTDETVIIGAHYDRADVGCGVFDNWSGIVVMTQLYKTMAPMKTKKSYIFVAFDKEEVGLRGSNQMVKAMTPAQIANTCSMLNFDSFGQAAPMSLRSVSSPKLLDLAKEIGKDGGIKFQDVEIPNASADSASFLGKKIASITISGLAGNWATILHTPNDKLKSVNMDSVYVGYRFGLVFAARLDAAGCRDYN